MNGLLGGFGSQRYEGVNSALRLARAQSKQALLDVEKGLQMEVRGAYPKNLG